MNSGGGEGRSKEGAMVERVPLPETTLHSLESGSVSEAGKPLAPC